MNPKEFHQLIEKTILRPKEREKAWELYKNTSPQAGEKFVKEIRTSKTHLQNNHALRDSPVPYKIWGIEQIEQGAINQMIGAAKLPVAVAGALMPDAHEGYGLPIGGVLATDNAVIPYAVGVDIACRMMLSIFPQSGESLNNPKTAEFKRLYNALIFNTIFGAGGEGSHKGKYDHAVLDESKWKISTLVNGLRPTAITQIGTSGTGNHFVEWGEIEILDEKNPMGLPVGNYLALLSHSGSRGVGYKIAEYYTQLAMSQMPGLDESVKHLAWLPLDSGAGQEYWEAMQLAGEFASANHQIIHSMMAKALGAEPLAIIENHHNFAWKEKIKINDVEKVVVIHRKGATPAGEDVLGIIPGTMADLGYIVKGKGNEEALFSASHGSGRQMSRSQAFKVIKPEHQIQYLKQRNVTLIGGGLDESPQAYKPIQKVIESQKDLVDVLGTFQPRIVRMAEDKKRRR